ncbi:MAG: hypothetical protein Q7S49_01495 [bacterium]|nr:hypothetical protein [bacterium]
MIGSVLAIAVFFGLAVLFRALAQRNILWVIMPANCYGLVTTMKNESGDLTQGGGGVVNIIHNVPGKKLVKTHHDLMKWHFEDGKERRGILFILLGIEWIGLFRTLRTNKIRRFRYGKRPKTPEESRKADEPFGDYFLMDDDLVTEYVPFSGEQAISVTDAESQDVFELNFLLNTIEEAVRPLMAIRVADANAILAGMIKEKINAVTGTKPPQYFIKASPESTREIIEAALVATAEAEQEVGKKIAKINLISTDMDEKDRELFELEARTKLQNEAAIAVATKNRDVQILTNTGDADRVERVIKPAAENERTVAVRVAEAYENNKVVTTFAPGANTMIPLAK